MIVSPSIWACFGLFLTGDFCGDFCGIVEYHQATLKMLSMRLLMGPGNSFEENEMLVIRGSQNENFVGRIKSKSIAPLNRVEAVFHI